MVKGYNNIPFNRRICLDAPFSEGVGVATLDVSRAGMAAYNHSMTLVGTPAWVQLPLSNISVLSFNPATPDYVWIPLAAQSADMDFVAGAFSLAAWIFCDDLTAIRTIMMRGSNLNNGWQLYVSITGQVAIVTNQAAAQQTSLSLAGLITIGTWHLIGVTRLGASCRVYVDGIDHTDTVGVHVNPVTCPTQLIIGCNDLLAEPFDGYIWRPRAWTRNISADEMLEIFQAERHLLGI